MEKERTADAAMPETATSAIQFGAVQAYDGSNHESVVAIYDGQKRRGIEPWMDSRNHRPGNNWRRGCTFALKNMRVAVVLFGSNGTDPPLPIPIQSRKRFGHCGVTRHRATVRSWWAIVAEALAGSTDCYEVTPSSDFPPEAQWESFDGTIGHQVIYWPRNPDTICPRHPIMAFGGRPHGSGA